MPLCGTFQYTGVVPQNFRHSARWKLADPFETVIWKSWFRRFWKGDPLVQNRLVGLWPTLEISDGHLIFRASGPYRAQISSASLQLDPALVDVFQVGDVLNLVRTGTADIGVSLQRVGQLIFAVGAVSVLPMGGTVIVRSGPDLDLSASRRDQWPRADTWVDVSVSGKTTRLRGDEETTMDDYRVSVIRCFQDGIPGTYECVAISLKGTCPHEAAVHSTKLLERPNAGLVMTDWSI